MDIVEAEPDEELAKIPSARTSHRAVLQDDHALLGRSLQGARSIRKCALLMRELAVYPLRVLVLEPTVHLPGR